MNKNGCCICISFGRWWGFGFHNSGWSKRLWLGIAEVVYLPVLFGSTAFSVASWANWMIDPNLLNDKMPNTNKPTKREMHSALILAPLIECELKSDSAIQLLFETIKSLRGGKS